MRIFLKIYLICLVAFNEAFNRIDDATKADGNDGDRFNGKNWA